MSKLTRRRALNGVTVLAIAATGAAWAGCGDDSEDAVNEIIDSAGEQVDEALEDAGAQSQDVQDEIEDQIGGAEETTNQALEDAESP